MQLQCCPMAGLLAMACTLMLLAAIEGDAARLGIDSTLHAASSEPTPPALPDSYTVRYTFSLPYTARVQPQAITYPVAFFKDGPKRHIRMETYNATNVMIYRKGRTLELAPRIDRQVCLAFDDGEVDLAALPDVRGWAYAGQEALPKGDGSSESVAGELLLDVWEYRATHEGKRVVYRYHVTQEGVPKRLWMQGQNLFSGAHFDHWVVTYTDYSPGRPDPTLFKTPELCKDKLAMTPPAVSGPRGGGGALRASRLRMEAVLPRVRYSGDAEYDAFLGGHGAGRPHPSSRAEYERRGAQFRSHARMIEAHNAAAAAGVHTFTLAMNRFGDYSHEEFVALMLPHRQRLQQQSGMAAEDGAEGEEQQRRRRSKGPGRHELPHRALVDAARLPAEVSWRGTGADSMGPKDQATCGSCWSFAAAGAMEGAWFLSTGQRVSFSSQQILDCAWGFVPGSEGAAMACDGGDPWAGIGHIVDAGGIALTEDYQYKGQDGYCLANSTRLVGKFEGYARLPAYDDAAVMEALFSRGPLSICFDASRPSFAFYSSGVFQDTECKWKPSELDHSMVLVGYGTSEQGDYWEIKNSWSDNWGEGGYFKVLRDNHGCGTASDVVYAVTAAGSGRGSV